MNPYRPSSETDETPPELLSSINTIIVLFVKVGLYACVAFIIAMAIKVGLSGQWMAAIGTLTVATVLATIAWDLK